MFWFLYLAHFIGDYPLQPMWLVQAKRRWPGLLLHVAIHLAVLLVIAGSWRGHLWPYLLALAGMPFAIDAFKNWLERVRPQWRASAYLFDQLLHLLSIILVTAWIKRSQEMAIEPEAERWAMLTWGYLLATYVWFISERLIVRPETPYGRTVMDEQWPRMVMRGLLLTTLLLLAGARPSVAVLASVGLALPYQSRSFRWRGIITDLAVALTVAASALIALRSSG